MHLSQLKLIAFKNYEQAKLQLAPQLNAFTGLNGMGKTNLLEAIYYLCMCRSPMGLNDRHLSKHGSDFFRLEGHFVHQEEAHLVVAKVQPGRRKEFSKNGVVYPLLSEHIGFIPVVFSAPIDLELILEGSEIRRRFLNNSLSQIDPQYLNHLITYNKLLQQRNALLKQFAENRTFNSGLLAIYSHQMLVPAQYIFEARTQYIASISPHVEALVNTLSSQGEQVEIIYKSQLDEQRLDQLFEASLEKDRILQRTTHGIHKDDLAFLLNGHPVKRFGSQGQAKSLTLALKLAQFERIRTATGKKPLLLLDDIFDRLDAKRVEALLAILAGASFGQVFITDTQSERIEPILQNKFVDYRKFSVQEGAVLTQPEP